jgi:heterodisulfide reductase subunit B
VTHFLYYPGCSMDASARAYADSLEAISAPLGLELEEIEDWNCCGATEYQGISPTRAHALISRNLALAEAQKNGSHTVVAPCSACFLNLSKTEHYLREDKALATKVNTALAAAGLHYTPGSIEVRHLLEIIFFDIGIETIHSHVTRPLGGLKVAPYLGCLVTRPDYDGRWASHEHPREFDRLLRTLGAQVVDFPLKTDCCGGHMTQISPATGFELIRRLIHAAVEAGADMLVTLCPMCQMNIDAYQAEMNRHFKTSYHMPILFFTQLIGLAFGFPPEKLGIGTEIVSARQALNKIGIEVPVTEAQEPVGAGAAGPPRRPRAKQTGLPMPAMPGEDGEAPR